MVRMKLKREIALRKDLSRCRLLTVISWLQACARMHELKKKGSSHEKEF
jgi:hypothetical protein